jgi:hypothetical protein
MCILIILILIALEIGIVCLSRTIQNIQWKKFVNDTIVLKDTITFMVNGKEYEYNPKDNFEEWYKKISKTT